MPRRLHLKYLGNWPCCSLHNLHHDRGEDRYREEDEKVRQRFKKKKSIISKLTVVVRECLSTLIVIILSFFSPRISDYDARSPECSRETRFDMIILQLSSPLCHMPDLSVGRGVQLALLTINQPDGGGGGWRRWDGEALAGTGCWPTLHYTHATDFYMCEKKEKKNSWLSILLFSFLALFPPLSLLASLARLSPPPSFFHLKASNIHHPLSPNTLSTERAAVRAQQGESTKWTKYEDIRSS